MSVSLEVGDKIVFVGYPSYLQGLKGEIERVTNSGELAKVNFVDGRSILIDTFQLRKQEI